MATDWLTRQQIDEVLEQLSADDLIEAVDTAGGQKAKVASIAFNQAANRTLGDPEKGRWTERIRAADFRYFVDQIGEAVNVDSPLSDATSTLLDSPELGVEDSDPLTLEDYQPAIT